MVGVRVVGVRVVGVRMVDAACWVPGGASGAVASSTGWALRCRSSSVEGGKMICQLTVVVVDIRGKDDLSAYGRGGRHKGER